MLVFRASIRKAIADVTRRKGRTLLVVLGILISVLGLTGVDISADALDNAFAYTQNQSASPDILFSTSATTAAITPAIEHISNVATVALVTTYDTRWQIGSGSGHVTLHIIAPPDFPAMKLSPMQLTSGHLPGNNEIVMESSDTALQRIAINDQIMLEGVNGTVSLHVTGFSRTRGLPSAGLTSIGTAYMSSDGLFQLAHLTSPNTLEVKVHDRGTLQKTAQAIVTTLHNQHVTVQQATFVDNSQATVAAHGLFLILRVISIVALLLTSILIINTMTTLITEQIRIVGIMKALGGTRGAIIRSYMLSIAMYAVLGTILGIALGVVVGYQLTVFLASILTLDLGPIQITPQVILISLAVGLGIPFIAAWFPLWQGTRITVREAMAAYGVSQIRSGRKRTLSTRISATWIPQTVWLGVRTIFRKRWRAILTLLALIMAGSVFLAVQATTSSVNTTLNELFQMYSPDVIVYTQPVPYNKFAHLLNGVNNIARIERRDGENVSAEGGTMLLLGMEPDTQMYHYQLLSGRWLRANDQNALVISDVVAAKTHLGVGQTLTFSNATNKVTWRIIGEVHDLDAGLGIMGSIFTPINSYYAFNGNPADIAQGIVIQSHDRSAAAVDQLATHVDHVLTQAGLVPTVITQQQYMQRDQAQYQYLYLLLNAVTAIVALVGLLGLFNTLSSSVVERRQEIGILRSLGATGWRVGFVFWVESIALATLAWLISVIFGIPAAYGFVSLLTAVFVPLTFSFQPMAFVLVLVFVLVLATLASFGPALSASRIRIANSLRYE